MDTKNVGMIGLGLMGSMACSRIMDTKGRKMIEGDFAPRPAWRST